MELSNDQHRDIDYWINASWILTTIQVNTFRYMRRTFRRPSNGGK